jgi:subtilisin family serine protease
VPEFVALSGEVTGGFAPAGTDQSSAAFFANGVQWNMRLIRAHEVWGPSLGGLGVRVCVIDSGIDETHIDIAGKVLASRSFVLNPNGTPQLAAIDSNFHGTHVASTITSNGIGVASVAPDAKLLIAKVFAATGGAPFNRIVDALAWCTDEGADVINMSLGSFSQVNQATIDVYQNAVNYALTRGVVVVVAAGNENRVLPHPDSTSLPAQLQGVLSVGSVGPITSQPAGWPNVIGDTYDRRGFYSNYGTAVNVFAPGGIGSLPLSFLPRRQGNSQTDNIVAACASASNATCVGGRSYTSSAGTSMAAPHVAGLAAVLRAEIGGPRTVATAERVKACILNSAVNIGPATTFGGGRIDVARAFALLKSGGC